MTENAINDIPALRIALGGKRIGLITGPSAVNDRYESTVDVLMDLCKIERFFAPEHGVRGDRQAGVDIGDEVDPRTGVPVISMYGDNKHISAENLAGLDALVFDIAGIGVRYYTYIFTLAYAMEDAAKHGLKLIVLDRINPLGLNRVEGNMIKAEFDSFVGGYSLAARYGLTLGEIACYINDAYGIGCDLSVMRCTNLKRTDELFNENLFWVAPSPNIPTPMTALLFTGCCYFEGTNVSEGRGTTRPFELIGAPFIDAPALASKMNGLNLPGVRFREAHFSPSFSKHVGEICHGIQVHVTDTSAFRSYETGLYLVESVREICPEFQFIKPREDGDGRWFFDLLLGDDSFRKGEKNAKAMIELAESQRGEYWDRVKPYLLY